MQPIFDPDIFPDNRADPMEITPIRIAHGIDWVCNPDAGTLEAFYDFSDYSFAHPEAELTARAYLDEPDRVVITSQMVAPRDIDIFNKVLLYFRRRFRHVLLLTSDDLIEVKPLS